MATIGRDLPLGALCIPCGHIDSAVAASLATIPDFADHFASEVRLSRRSAAPLRPLNLYPRKFIILSWVKSPFTQAEQSHAHDFCVVSFEPHS